MKSVKMFFGMMLCLVVLAGQAQATVLDFEAVDITDSLGIEHALNAYGTPYGVSFSNWGIATDESLELFKKPLKTVSSASISFTNPVNLVSFDFDHWGDVTISAFNGKDNLGSYDLDDAVNNLSFLPPSWGSFIITSITFDLGDRAGLLVDNLKFSSVPLPGAAILLGSGLLGLVGLRRREII